MLLTARIRGLSLHEFRMRCFSENTTILFGLILLLFFSCFRHVRPEGNKKPRMLRGALILFCLAGGLVHCLAVPAPQVRNFTREDYKASSQNWSVAQDGNGFLYVGNSIGLLEYDGMTWTLHPSPNGNIIRAVAADSSGRIFTSGYQEVGFWTRNESGTLSYTSLNEQAARFFTQNVEFWQIHTEGGRVIFSSFTQMLIYENGEFRAHNFPAFTNSLFFTGGKVLINAMNNGIYEFRDGAEIPFLTGDFFRSKIVRFFLPAGAGRFLIGTASHGIFMADGEKITEWECPENGYFREKQINRGLLLPGGDLLVGTILDGVTLVDSLGRLKWRLNTANGLQNNTVLGLMKDRDGNVWVALDQGIDFIGTVDRNGIRFVPVENAGAVYAAALFEGKLYLGTNQGLFAGPGDPGEGRFALVEGTQGQVWDLAVVGNQLVAGHNGGTFLVRDGQAHLISTVSGGFCIRPDPFEPGSYLQCSYSNLVQYRQREGRLALSRVFYNFNELIRFIEFDHLGNLWAGHMYRGIFRLKFNPGRDSISITGYYGQQSAFGKDHLIHVFKLENRVVFTTGEMLYAYEGLQDTILPYDLLNRQLGRFARALRIIPAPNHHYWFITSGGIGLLKIEETRVTLVREYPAEVFGNQLISDYVNIFPTGEKEALVCLENGYARLNAAVKGNTSPLATMAPSLRSAHLSNPDMLPAPRSIRTGKIKIPWSENSLHLRFAIPFFDIHPLSLQWNMEGLGNGWSEKRESPDIAFERLPAGKYQLRVRAVDPWGNRSREFATALTVQPPWYATGLARSFYLLLAAALLLLFRKAVADKTRRNELREREEKERELITLKNEKLQSEISFKSKELANSTMSILKKNEFLLHLKELLIQQKNSLGSRYPEKYLSDVIRKIDASLSSQDDWNIFETHFERAHEQFLQKTKERFPELTATDLRLCAFLRMNLSSKEIAPMLGISVRGVENHRYRLRKKMGLDRDQKLIDLILSL